MKKVLKNEKGINLISLTIIVIVILTLTGTVLYNVKDNLGIQRLKSMQTDIANLRDKVSLYYNQYGKIPADTNIQYTTIENISKEELLSPEDKNGQFYVIYLSTLENLTLTYGEEYENYKEIIKNVGDRTNEEISEEVSKLKDVYIINGNTHNIFYASGIKYDNKTFYTDYTSEDVDKEKVTLIDKDSISDNWSPQYDKTTIYKDENEDIAYIPEGFSVSRKTRRK